MVDGAFARDLGYLDLFFTKLEAHARTLGPGPQAELLRLLAEERTRWPEIRRLLGGGAPISAASGEPAASPARPAAPQTRPAPPGLTVGSLIGEGRAPRG